MIRKNVGALVPVVLAAALSACTGTVIEHGENEGPSGSGGSTGGPGSGSSTGSGSGTGSGSSTGNPGTGGTGSTGGTAVVLNLKGFPKNYRFIRLTNDQWVNTTKDLLGVADGADLATSFQQAVPGTTDFVNNELLLDVDTRGWSDFQAASEALAAKVTATDAALAKVYTGTDAAGFISTFGRRAFRRPLTSAEKTSYMTLFSSGSTLSGSRSAFAKGASLVIRAMLQSPNFLYRSEMAPVGSPLSGYEMAAKLSLWLRNTTPNDTLLDAAAAGKLDSADGVVTMTKSMLEEAGATAVMRDFHGQYLHFDRYQNLTKVGVSNYSTTINPELEESSYLFFDKIFTKGLGLKDVFTSTMGFVGANMAKLYGNGVAAPSSGYAERDLGEKRPGYFSQLPFLMLHSHNGDPDSIHRGVSMNLDVLCSTLGPPAAQIPPLPARMKGQTNRQVVDATTAGCGQLCHNQMINPMGFAFEHFDGMGQYRDTEMNMGEALQIDSSGSFDFIDGTKTYKDSAELMKLLATEPQVHMCYAKKLASYGLQRDVIEKDMPLLNTLKTSSMASTGSVKQLILDLVKQDAFRIRAGGAS